MFSGLFIFQNICPKLRALQRDRSLFFEVASLVFKKLTLTTAAEQLAALIKFSVHTLAIENRCDHHRYIYSF